MITTALIDFVSFVISSMFGLLPSGALPQNIADAFDYFLNYARMFDAVVPVGALFRVLSAVLAFEVIWITFRIGKWVIHLFRGN